MYSFLENHKKKEDPDTCTKLCITNRRLLTGTDVYTPQVRQQMLCRIAAIADRHLADAIILREKDLSSGQYADLAEAVVTLCREKELPLVLHHFADIAAARMSAGCMQTCALHLSFGDFLEIKKKQQDGHLPVDVFPLLGVSTHTLEEARIAEQLGAAYITASHIFPTTCKPGVPPRGLNYLREVCHAVSIPVYALGGIHPPQIQSCLDAGAAGVCMMSEYFSSTLPST